MIRHIALALTIAAVSTSAALLAYVFCVATAHAEQNTDLILRQSMNAWEQCAVEKAKRYAAGPDSAMFIVDVVMKTCASEMNAARDVLMRVLTTLEPSMQAASFDSFRRITVQAASEAILEARSKR